MPVFYLLLVFFLTHLDLEKAHAWGWDEFKEESMTPYSTDARYALWIGSGLTVTFLVFEDSVIDPFQKKQARNKTLGDSSKWGDWMGQLVPNALYIGGMSYLGYKGDPQGFRRAMGMFKASAYSVSVTTLLKYTVREPRPIDSSWKNSFPSGHTTTAFAFSGYVMAEHEYWLGIPALILSTFIGYSRINDNMHWLHDVTAGATIGWVYGWGISKLQQQKEKDQNLKTSQEEKVSFLVPLLDSKTVGLGFFKEF